MAEQQEPQQISVVGGLCEMCQQLLVLLIEKRYSEQQKFNPKEYNTSFTHHETISNLRLSAASGCALCRVCLKEAYRCSKLNKSIYRYDGDRHVADEEYMEGLAGDGPFTDENPGRQGKRKPKNEEGQANEPFRDDNEDEEDDFQFEPSDHEFEDVDSRDDNIEHRQRGRENRRQSKLPYSSTFSFEGIKHWILLFRNEKGMFCRLSLLLKDSDQHNLAQYGLPSQDARFDILQSWVKDCNQDHNLCVSKGGSSLPTRLLAISRDSTHLVLSSDLGYTIEYATLSHCWGLAQPLRLLKASYTAFQQEIPQERLCKTFKDAIFIALKLGLKFLWIDSLCIIQDDVADWRRESSSMSEVYGNSYLNIAAADAKDGTYGCFFEDTFQQHSRVQVSVTVGIRHYNFECSPTSVYHSCVLQTPLQSRAWTLQERLLTPRSLHFSRTQILWECNQRVACESFPKEIPSSLLNRSYMMKRDLSRFWASIVEQYTSCALTKKSDKLVAMSGIIRKVQTLRHDKCFAGLWWNNMATELLWCATTVTNPYLMYRAPSWSWAAVDSEVNFYKGGYHTQDDTLQAHILDAHVYPCGEDYLGELQGGTVKLLCRILTQATVLERGDKSGLHVPVPLRVNIKGAEMQFTGSLYWDYTTPVDEVYLLPIVDFADGLMLKPTGVEKGQYQRVGSFNLRSDEKQSFAAVLGNGGPFVDEDATAGRIDDDRYPDEHYIINIV